MAILSKFLMEFQRVVILTRPDGLTQTQPEIFRFRSALMK